MNILNKLRGNNITSDTVIIIPAYNEEKNILRTLRLIKRSGFLGDIIVVDDGSNDKTKFFAQREGAKVISNDKNRGKTYSFFKAIKFALKEYEPKSIITMDADMIDFHKNSLKKLIKFTQEYTENGKSMMLIPQYIEGDFKTNYKHSGIRAFSIPALYKLLQSPVKKYPKRFSLELFLSDFFEVKGDAYLIRDKFFAMPAYRGKSQKQATQNRDLLRYLQFGRKHVKARLRPRL